jgi:hypothetical protein
VNALIRLAAITSTRARPAGGAALRPFLLLGLGLMLGACSKCDVPNWQHSGAGDTSAACHDGPQSQ